MRRRLRVLVVDDNQDMVLTTAQLLDFSGYETKGCYSGQDALDCIREFDPDVALVDIRMPGMSGWELAQRIRQLLPRPRPRLIGISGEHMQESDKILAQMRGFDHYILKPADPDTLMLLLAETKRDFLL